MEKIANQSKFWKTVTVITYTDRDPYTGEEDVTRETVTNVFDDRDKAIASISTRTSSPFAEVTSVKIYEYEVKSVRELTYKQKEVVKQVHELTWVWE